MRAEGSNESQVTLKIPRPLYVQLKQVIQGSGFHSVTEFVVYVLRPFSNHGPGGQRAYFYASLGIFSEVNESVEPLSPAEIEAVRRRLDSLGYP